MHWTGSSLCTGTRAQPRLLLLRRNQHLLDVTSGQGADATDGPAEEEAAARIERAQGLIEALAADHPGRPVVDTLLQQSRSSLADGRARRVATEENSSLSDQAIADVAFRTRAFTRAQVRAAQVVETLVPPEQNTAELIKDRSVQ